MKLPNNSPLPGPIRWVALDAVGTVMHPFPPAAEVYAQVARRHGSTLTAEEITTRFRRQLQQIGGTDDQLPADERHRTSEALERERWRAIVAAVIDDVPKPDDCFEELFLHFGKPTAWRCFPDVGPAIAALRRAGLQVALASNFDGRLHEVCDGHPELQPIGCRVISAEVGYRKPGRRFFETLLEATRSPPQEVLMVGDDRENDFVGAREAGLPALLINRRGTPGPDEIGSLIDLAEIVRSSNG
ncbi:MAG: HAD family hydrolase [Planctomycetales bacterium]